MLSFILWLVSFASVGAQAQTHKSAPAPAPASSTSPLFETKIRPMLLTFCIGCHGKEAPQGGLRLDVAMPLAKAQEMLNRVKGEGGGQRMPLGAKLSDDKIAALEAWVVAGAQWSSAKPIATLSLIEKGKQHWAFQPLTRPGVPKTKLAGWVRSPIDAFILKRLEDKGLKPAPTASRRELIRRLTYDLIGLPPSPQEVAAFDTDKSPDAYAKLVDRLLDSPHYGEKWGRHWLDLVRYAETNSYERDNPKPHIYKYRDYVIRAFNDDKPFDRFLREQIAGDEMPDATGDAQIATAYYRLGIWDDEPADAKQAEYDDMDDLVATTGQTFLGLTLDCARCHDHKLDPIPQKDYYRFLSFFHNINRFKNGGPTDEVTYFSTAEQRLAYERGAAELDVKRKTNAAQIALIEAEYRKLRPSLLDPNDISDLHYRYFQGTWNHIPDFDKIKPEAVGALTTRAISLSPRKRDENFGFVYEGFLNVLKEGDYTFFLDSDDGSRLTIAGKKLLEKDMGGGQGNEMHGIVHLARGRIPFRLDYFEGAPPFGLNFAWGGPGFVRRPLSPLSDCSELGLPSLIAAELPLLGGDRAAKYSALTKEQTALAVQEPPGEKILCVSEAGAKAPDTFVLLRGNPTTPGERVEPAFPVCVSGKMASVPTRPMNAKTTGRRTALAAWLASPDNPLTARVIVNRLWQHHFGRGIVRTPNDFGLQGAAPTHPELLNWLAKEFIAQGWSMKRLHRLILTSNTYKQSSRSNKIGLDRDPQNDLFWRFDMRRLTAEEVRDSLLAVSGNLNLKMFGESIYPEMPKAILAGQSIPGADWHTELMKPDDLNRRSIYVHLKRSLIYPLFASFDLPETDRPIPVRFSSTQPTQALGLMNGALFNKQAAVLADRVRAELVVKPPADSPARGANNAVPISVVPNTAAGNRIFAARVFSLVLQRPATEPEIAEGLALMQRLEKRGAKHELAQNYLCLMALNLDEFMYLD